MVNPLGVKKFLTTYHIVGFSNRMKHILYILIVFICTANLGCTIVFKAKEIELESTPPITKLIVPPQLPQFAFSDLSRLRIQPDP